MDWFYYDFIILIKKCEIPHRNLGKAILFSRNQVFLSEKLKTLTSSNYHRVQYFLLKLCTRFLLTNFYKRVFGIFLYCLDLELFAKIKKTCFYTLIFYIFINNSRSKQNKKNPGHPFVDIVK